MNNIVDYKIEVLKDGIFNREIKWVVDSNPQVDFNADSAIKSSFKCELYEEIDINHEELNPMMFRNGVWSSLGVFKPTTITTKGDEYRKTFSVEAYDRAWVLKMTKTESIIHLSAGASYMTVIQQMLTPCGIRNVVKDSSSAILPCDREDWQIGTDYLTIINTLLTEIGFNEIWFDESGAAHLEKYSSSSNGDIKHQYSSIDFELSPISSEFELEEDIYDAPNVFIGICSNADRTETLTATAENNNVLSRKSTVARNMRIPQINKLNQISDQEALQTYVDKLRDESMLGTQTITFHTYNESGHGLKDTIAIEHPQLFGTYTEVGWSITMALGELMQHKARKTVL